MVFEKNLRWCNFVLCGIGASFQSGNTALRIMLVDEQEIENLLNEHSDSEYEWQNDNEL